MVTTIDLGLRPYQEVLEMQKGLYDAGIAAKRAGDKVDERLLLVEHFPVYTLGRHGKEHNMLSRIPGVEVHKIGRGGDITFHGPGQLVAYPILDLEAHGLGVKRYVELLEEAVIRVCAHYGVAAERADGAPGVWIETGTPRERKICALGIQCSRFVTMHGVGFNINTDLSYFSHINPCGFIDKGVTSLALEVGHPIEMAEAKTLFADILLGLLDR